MKQETGDSQKVYCCEAINNTELTEHPGVANYAKERIYRKLAFIISEKKIKKQKRNYETIFSLDLFVFTEEELENVIENRIMHDRRWRS